MEPKVTNRRKPKTRKKWIEINARFINGETRDLAKFTHKGDAHVYVNGLQASPATTVEEIFVD